MAKKRILHIIQSLGNGGWENSLLQTLPLLDDFEHTIITLKELGELAPRFIAKSIPVYTVHCKWFLNIPAVLRLQKLVKKEAPTIIITYLFHADMLGRFFLQPITRAPVIPFLGTTYNHPRYFIARLFEIISQGFVVHYLANSQAVKQTYQEKIGVKDERITVIPIGIDTHYFNTLSPNVELQKMLAIHPEDFVIICVANLHPNKGHRYLIEAFESLSKLQNTDPSLPPLKLIIVGDGEEKENLFKQIENYQSRENIFFLGRRSDVPQLLKISHLFVLPTLFEGMSRAIMEAMACKIAIITTDIPENKILITDKETGLLVPPHSTKDLEQAIQTLLRDPHLREYLGIEGQHFLEKNFSLENSLKLLRQFFYSL